MEAAGALGMLATATQDPACLQHLVAFFHQVLFIPVFSRSCSLLGSVCQKNVQAEFVTACDKFVHKCRLPWLSLQRTSRSAAALQRLGLSLQSPQVLWH